MQNKTPFHREPLLHFFVAAALVFGLHALGGSNTEATTDRIHVSLAQIDLDVDDAVIRRRLRQKMEFITTIDTELMAPSNTELEAYLTDHAEQYLFEPRYDFEQVYFRGGASSRLVGAIAMLREGQAGAEQLGDLINLPQGMSDAVKTDIIRVFGTDFADALTGIEPGEWQGPIESGFGLHFVRLAAVTAPRMPTLGEVRQAVENDYLADMAAASRATAYEVLAAGYEIEIEMPD